MVIASVYFVAVVAVHTAVDVLKPKLTNISSPCFAASVYGGTTNERSYVI